MHIAFDDLGIHADDGDFFFHENFAHIFQKPRKVLTHYKHFHREDSPFGITPTDLNQSFLSLFIQVTNIGAIRTVNGHSSSACHKAHNLIRRGRMTTTRKLRQKRIHTDNQHLALGGLGLGFGSENFFFLFLFGL